MPALNAPPLAGIRVLELSTGIAAQTAGMLLADLGAEVVRPLGAAPPCAEDLPGFVCWNRGKTLVRDPGGPWAAVEIRRLALRADILIADARPGKLESRGLDSATMNAAAPALVHLWMPPIAAGGRWSQLPHDDLLLDAVAGFAAHHPATQECPVASVVPARLHLHGAMAAGAAVAGLLARTRDGRGRAVTVTGLQAVGAALCTLVARAIDGPPIISVGKAVTGGPQFRLYQAGDGQWMFLGALSPEILFRALEVLGRLDIMAREDIAGDFVNIMRPDIAASVGADLEAVFLTRSTDAWLAAFAEVDVPAARQCAPADWLTGEVIAGACPPLRRAHRELGEITMPGVPVELDATPARGGDPALHGAAGDLRDVWTGVDAPAPAGGDRANAAGLPLAGLKVIDAASFLAGPFVSSLLATHGADVVKIESPAGDPYSVFTAPYAAINEHKRVLRLDLRADSDRSQFLALLAGADVAVDNLVPASLARLRLAPEVFARANPDLVRCSITAFGQHGPWAAFPGFDPLLQTMSGLAAIQGGSGRPVATSAPVHDVATGAMGALGTLAALYVRATRGTAQRVFASLAASSTLLQSGELTDYAGRPARAVGGVDHPGPNAWRRFYRARDRWIAIAATTPAQRVALLEVLDLQDMGAADDTTRAAGIAAALQSRTVEEWVTVLATAGVPACGTMERCELDDPFLVDQRYSHPVDTEAVGRMDLIGGFADWRGEPRPPGTAPGDFFIDPDAARRILVPGPFARAVRARETPQQGERS
ncbi:MAG: CoA transferase [Gammaproteobacteria bacterium]